MGCCASSGVEDIIYNDIGWSEGDGEKDSFVKVYFKDRRDAISLVSTVSDEAGSQDTTAISMGMHKLHPSPASESLAEDTETHTSVALPEPKMPLETGMPKEKKYEGSLIARVLQRNFPELIDALDPKKAATYLYGVAIIDDSELESATKEFLCRKDRASTLMRLLIRKLRANPHWCHDAFVALKEAGLSMESIIQELDNCASESQSTRLHSSNTLPTVGEENEDDIETSMKKPNDDQCSKHSQSGQEDPDQHDQQEKIPDQPANLDSHVKSTDEVITIPEDQESQWARPHRDSGVEDTGATAAASPAQSDASIERDKNGNTKLHLAVENQDVKAVRMMVNSKGARNIINCQNNEGQTALHISIIKRFVMVTVELLKCSKCDPYLFDKDKKTPLHYACSLGLIDLVKPILNSKRCSVECVNAPDDAGDSAIHIATRNGYTEIVKLLRKNKANQKQKNHEGETPSSIAERSGSSELIASSQSQGILKAMKTKLKRSASFSLTRAASKTSVASQSQSESNFKYN